MSKSSSEKSTSSSSQKSNLAILLSSSLTGVWRGIIGLPFQHPFDNIKTNMQAYQTKFMNTFNTTYKKHGILGFYSGFSVNLMRVASKQIYRWPLQISLFGFYNNLFQQNISRGTLGAICGINMAMIEVFILCPFERVKVWLMTDIKHSNIRCFFNKFKFKSLYDGIMPVFCKQFVSWVTFLGATQLFKDLAYKSSNKNRLNDSLSALQIAYISLGTALVNTFFVMPIDCIKTNYQKSIQKQQYEQFKSQNHRFKGIIKQIYQKYGWQGFFKGWQIKLIQYNINSLFTVFIFEKLLKQYEKNVSKKRN